MPEPQGPSHALLREIAEEEGQSISMTLPTHRSGAETTTGPVILRQLITTVGKNDDGTELDQLLRPLRALVDDRAFWQQQNLGLVLISSPGGLRAMSVPHELPAEVSVGAPRLRPAIGFASGAEPFHLLALSTNKLRLFAANATSIEQLELTDIPESVDELPEDRDPQKQLQQAPQGGGEVSFHGHGAAAEADNARTDRFFRVVAQGLDRLLGADAPAMVLACVDANFAHFRNVAGRLTIVGEHISGNADRTPVHELHTEARAIMRRYRTAADTELVESFGDRVGTGLASTELRAILRAADDGRVQTLLVSQVAAVSSNAVLRNDPVDQAISAVLRTGGTVRALPEGLQAEHGIAAIFRY